MDHINAHPWLRRCPEAQVRSPHARARGEVIGATVVRVGSPPNLGFLQAATIRMEGWHGHVAMHIEGMQGLWAVERASEAELSPLT